RRSRASVGWVRPRVAKIPRATSRHESRSNRGDGQLPRVTSRSVAARLVDRQCVADHPGGAGLATRAVDLAIRHRVVAALRHRGAAEVGGALTIVLAVDRAVAVERLAIHGDLSADVLA